jgi:ribosome-binding ATPase
MKIGIVGLPNVGKSTLFKALTKIAVDINNYPFCTIEPNVGIVEVPDERVDKLAELSDSKKKIFTTIEFVDIAGLVEGAAEGQGLGNKFLQNIREVDAIVQVVRLFENDKITHVHGKIDPVRDMGVINAELILKDIETIDKRLFKLQREVRGNDKEAAKKFEITQKLKEILDENELSKIQSFIKDLGDDFELIEDLHLLSFKPILYVFNANKPEKIAGHGLSADAFLSLDIKTEEELLELSDKERQELELKSDLAALIKKSYTLLNLMTFLTSGEPETRAWTVPVDSSAPRAGRAIHGDFEEKFICAEIIAYDDLVKIGSKSAAREKGLVRTEGKTYVVQDGDVIEFKI